MSRGADVNARCRGASPADAGPRPRPSCPADATPLHYAALGARPGRAGAVEALLAAGASPHRRDEHGSTPLHVACFRGAAEAASALLAAAADRPAAAGDDGCTDDDAATPYAARHDYVERFAPLHRLVGVGTSDRDPTGMVEALVRRGADPGAYSRKGLSPLHLAAQLGKARACTALVRAGADAALPRLGCGRGTPIHTAVRHGKVAALRAILDALPPGHPAVDARSTDGSTPLHLAAAAGSVDACEALLDAGADAAAATLDGDRPLHVAVWTNAIPVTDLCGNQTSS